MYKTKKGKIKVLLVDDSPLHLKVIKKSISCPEIEVIGTAQNGKEALNMVKDLDPDVICTDLEMPIMNGLELTSEVMSRYPRPILIISSSVQKEDTQNIFNLLDAGAVDVFPKPRNNINNISVNNNELIQKIKIISDVFVFSKKRDKIVGNINKTGSFLPLSSYNNCPVVAIGASTGGPTALKTILQNLEEGFPATFICVQHIAKGFLNGLIEWLQLDCHLPISIAKKGQKPEAMMVYFPPEDMHLEIDNQGKFCYLPPNKEEHCPSIDITFKSLASYYGSSLMGVLLTGMGDDGALGMQKISEAGGITIAQDESTSLIFGMPKRAIELSAAYYILPLDAIVEKIRKKISG